MANNFSKSLIKILIIIAVSIVLFIVLVPLISMAIDEGLGTTLIKIMLVIFVVGVVIDRLRRKNR